MKECHQYLENSGIREEGIWNKNLSRGKMKALSYYKQSKNKKGIRGEEWAEKWISTGEYENPVVTHKWLKQKKNTKIKN